MYKKLNNNFAFTLVEMLVVLMIISVLIILIIPNLSGKNEEITEKGCNALISVVQAQTDAYYLDNTEYPGSIDDLRSADYITEDQTKCSNDRVLTYDENKKVILSE